MLLFNYSNGGKIMLQLFTTDLFSFFLELALFVCILITFMLIINSLKKKIESLKDELDNYSRKTDRLEYNIETLKNIQKNNEKEIDRLNTQRCNTLNVISYEEQEVDKVINTISKSYSVSNKNKILLIKMMITYIINRQLSNDILSSIDTSKSLTESIKVLKAYYIDSDLSEDLNYDKTILSSLMSLILYKAKSK